jgi:hypothetical protein
MLAKTMVMGAVAAGLVATGAGGTFVGAPGTVSARSVPTAFSVSLDDDHHGDWDHHRDWDGRRDHDGGWWGHPWRWWHDWGISADTCRDGGGHVEWSRHRCEGGRFDDFHVR